MDNHDHDDAPLTDHLLEQFAGWYLICVLAIKALNRARAQKMGDDAK